MISWNILEQDAMIIYSFVFPHEVNMQELERMSELMPECATIMDKHRKLKEIFFLNSLPCGFVWSDSH